VRETEGGISISIADDGIGMPAELLSRIYDPFFTTKAVGDGMGMGLAITHGIIERHMGNIQVSSEVNKGTLFEIFLPAN